MNRNTYALINLNNIKENVKTIVSTYNDYKYYFGVVKADCYGHNSIKSVEAIIEGGCNYLAVATLDEALKIRKKIKDIPILCLGVIPSNHINSCIKNNITITINTYNYLEEIKNKKLNGLKAHIKINTGMNRLGVKTKEEFNQVYNTIINSKMFLEGIYSHIYNSLNKIDTNNQFKKFLEITEDIDLSKIPIIHLAASSTLINYPKLEFANGCRLGIAMYGFSNKKSLNLLSTFNLYSEIIEINEVENETVGYNGTYKVGKKEKIGVVPIGYADGIIRKNTGRYVFINNLKYKIVGNICMDMLFVKIDDKVKIHDKVEIIKDNNHIEEIATHLETIEYEVISTIGKRVPRVYIK